MRAVLNTVIRTEIGSNAVKRVRKAGRIPAVLYGHGKQNVNLSLVAEEINSLVRHHSKLVDLRGEVSETALLRDVHWNVYGTDVLHVDLTRVNLEERVHVVVPVELRGTAAGVHEGGVVESILHELEVECAAGSIPERIEIRIHDLSLGQALRAGSVVLPEGVRLLNDPDAIVVHCVTRAAEEEEAAPAAESVEPEVIGRKGKAEEDEGEEA